MPTPIKRVVVLMMENHSFDRVLGCMKAQYPSLEGVDPTAPAWNPDYPDATATIHQAETTARNIGNDPAHDTANVLAQLDGGNRGFVADFARVHPQAGPAERQEIMGWYPFGFLPALHFLAANFVICDHWFSSLPGQTWPNRFFVHSGTSLGHIDMPEGVFNPAVHDYDQRTIYDALDDAAPSVDWRIYYGDFPQSILLTHQWLKPAGYSPYARFAQDVANNALASYVFIEPSYFGTEENDQHPPQDVLRGDVLIADVFNTLRSNQAIFEETLLVLVYDEHGGFYDHVVPPATVAPDANTSAYAFNQLGVRVPAILVSPWLDPRYVSTVFDHTSIIRMACEMWNLPPLRARDAQANSPLNSLTWRATPRRAIPPAPTNQVPQAVIPTPSLTNQKQALYAFSQYAESRIGDPAVRQALMLRAPEAMGGAIPQGRLAVDRIQAFLADRQTASGDPSTNA
jgi:phospholipase C